MNARPSSWTGTKHAWLRSRHTQSAFTIGDVINVAVARGTAADLDRIYDGFEARTRSAIRTSFGIAAAAAAALVGRVHAPAPDDAKALLDLGLPAFTLGMVTIVAVLGGAFQLRELAQLPRERTVAPRLLVKFKRLGERQLGTPRPSSHVSDTAGLSWWLGSMVASIIVCVVFLVLWKEHPARLLTPVSAGVALALLPNVLAELLSSDKTPGDPIADAQRKLADSVGELRLDDYIHDHAWATHVDKIIEIKLNPPTTPADSHEPEPRDC